MSYIVLVIVHSSLNLLQNLNKCKNTFQLNIYLSLIKEWMYFINKDLALFEIEIIFFQIKTENRDSKLKIQVASFSGLRITQPAGRVLTSDWAINSFKMVVNENLFSVQSELFVPFLYTFFRNAKAGVSLIRSKYRNSLYSSKAVIVCDGAELCHDDIVISGF